LSELLALKVFDYDALSAFGCCIQIHKQLELACAAVPFKQAIAKLS
jgi:hypothetical protein